MGTVPLMGVTVALEWVIGESILEAEVVWMGPADAECRGILLKCSLNRAEVLT